MFAEWRNKLLELYSVLETEGDLVDNDTVCAGEKIIILIYALCVWFNRTIAERWQHSGSTIKICIQDAIRALLKCKRYFFAEPEDLPDSIRQPQILSFLQGLCRGVGWMSYYSCSISGACSYFETGSSKYLKIHLEW
jgi:hypothetical protein